MPEVIYRVEPHRIRRSRWPLVIPFAIGALVVGLAALGGLGSRPAVAPSAPPTDVAEASPLPTRPPLAVEGRSSAQLTPPDRVTCGALDAGRCRTILAAAEDALGPDVPKVAAAQVFDSIVCGDTLDCPPSLLAVAARYGSVGFTFGDGERVLVNVVERVTPPGSLDAAAPIVAWIVRSWAAAG